MSCALLDALRAWALYGGDGFRFDLATTLGAPTGFNRDAPFLTALLQDPRCAA
jgi:pullulanase/glycogen debranching enzyme